MNRRQAIGMIGALGAGAAVNPGSASANGHGKMVENALTGPPANHHLHLCGIHVAKNNPRFQVITQHYCGAVCEGLHQCLLYDSAGPAARLLGVEYIISDAIYRNLPETEKRYWHPHAYEVLGGLLIAPGMKPEDEMAFMNGVLTTWGKAWHTWPDPTTAVPTGEPLLIWSANGDGQVDPKVLADRDRQFNVSTADVRRSRGEAIGFDVPAVSPPKDMSAVGRQWTESGEDGPRRKR
jgi:hypothetical protein